MTAYEQLARRYCALLGEDADDRIDGVPVWRIAMADLEAAMNALDTFGLGRDSAARRSRIMQPAGGAAHRNDGRWWGNMRRHHGQSWFTSGPHRSSTCGIALSRSTAASFSDSAGAS